MGGSGEGQKTIRKRNPKKHEYIGLLKEPLPYAPTDILEILHEYPYEYRLQQMKDMCLMAIDCLSSPEFEGMTELLAFDISSYHEGWSSVIVFEEKDTEEVNWTDGRFPKFFKNPTERYIVYLAYCKADKFFKPEDFKKYSIAEGDVKKIYETMLLRRGYIATVNVLEEIINEKLRGKDWNWDFIKEQLVALQEGGVLMPWRKRG